MISRFFKWYLGLFAGLLILSSCDKDDDPKTRSFYMGFTPFPYEKSVEAVNYTYSKLETDGDIINHHFDNGVPWIEALNGQPFHQNIIDDWDFRKSKTSAKHKIYVSVTPINFSRDGLAAYRGEADNMALPAPWSTYPFNHINVETAYLNYCKRMIDFFQPDYFNMAIEANLLYVNNSTRWSEYLHLHRFIYTELKLAYPELTVFTSVSGAYLLPGFLDGNDHSQQRLAALQVLQDSDLYGISFYPYLSKYLGQTYPTTTLEELFSISPKPVAIAETGFTAQTFTIDVGNGPVTVNSDPTKQEWYIKDLLYSSDRIKAVFVIQFVIRDYDQLWEQIGSPTDINIAWRDTGLYDESGNPRPALSAWRDYLSRKYQQPSE
jgi:hypothetical protein